MKRLAPPHGTKKERDRIEACFQTFRVVGQWTALGTALVQPLETEAKSVCAELVRTAKSEMKTAQPRNDNGLDSAADILSQQNALQHSTEMFRILADSMPQMVWSTLPDGMHDYYNARWYEFTGVPPGSTDGEGWNDMFHPEDQERAWNIWRHSLESGEPYEINYRLRHRSGEYRWTLGRAMPVCNRKGEIIRWVGTCTDIHEAKETAELNEVLSRELSHRIKNIFAIVSGLIGLTVRERPEFAPVASDLQERIAALGRAHEFARPHSEESRPEMETNSLRELIGHILAAYPALSEDRLKISGDDHPIDDLSATPLALVFHELATNSAKYGALSAPDGRVEIAIRRDGSFVTLHWVETNGPPISEAPAHIGFGSRLVEMAVVRQLSGTLENRWPPTGLETSIRVKSSRLCRD